MHKVKESSELSFCAWTTRFHHGFVEVHPALWSFCGIITSMCLCDIIRCVWFTVYLVVRRQETVDNFALCTIKKKIKLPCLEIFFSRYESCFAINFIVF